MISKRRYVFGHGDRPLHVVLGVLVLTCACAPVTSRDDARTAASSSRSGAITDRHARPPAIDTLLIRNHTRVLAHDSLGGRGTGTAGALGAALYIARQLDQLGAVPLEGVPGAPSSYLLPVPLLRADVADATLTLTDENGVARVLRHGAGFVLGRVGRDGLHAAEGPVARLQADSESVEGGAWVLLDAPPGEAATRWLPAWKLAGAAGVVVRLARDAVVAAYHQQLGDVRWLLESGGPDPVWQPDLPVVMVAPAIAEALTEKGVRLSLAPRARTKAFVDYNVAGIIASDGLADDDPLIAMTAHYDHLGTIRGGSSTDSVFNGFSDNAAGVAMLLAIAAGAHAAPPVRPLLLLFPAAEEVGLLGSIHFVRDHPDLVDRMQALVNLDAGAPPAPPTRWRLAAGTRSWAGDVAATVVEAHGWTHRSDPGSPNSDHWPFVAAGVPAVFLIPDGGYEGVDSAGAERLRARWDRYHRPDDEWAPDFPFSGLGRYAALARDIAWALAQASTR
ncbi:MAG TPA: M28 family peptidase [Longimicrobiales bacterium]|nr:M28 family peptidase [Longimicrobiales bacterium]